MWNAGGCVNELLVRDWALFYQLFIMSGQNKQCECILFRTSLPVQSRIPRIWHLVLGAWDQNYIWNTHISDRVARPKIEPGSTVWYARTFITRPLQLHYSSYFLYQHTTIMVYAKGIPIPDGHGSLWVAILNSFIPTINRWITLSVLNVALSRRSYSFCVHHFSTVKPF